jgi:hypothetical protein
LTYGASSATYAGQIGWPNYNYEQTLEDGRCCKGQRSIVQEFLRMADKAFNDENFKEEIEKLGLSYIWQSQVKVTVSRVCITIKYL